VSTEHPVAEKPPGVLLTLSRTCGSASVVRSAFWRIPGRTASFRSCRIASGRTGSFWPYLAIPGRTGSRQIIFTGTAALLPYHRLGTRADPGGGRAHARGRPGGQRPRPRRVLRKIKSPSYDGARVTALEWHYRRLLPAYPRGYRSAHGDEIKAALDDLSAARTSTRSTRPGSGRSTCGCSASSAGSLDNETPCRPCAPGSAVGPCRQSLTVTSAAMRLLSTLTTRSSGNAPRRCRERPRRAPRPEGFAP
jgi:hypothetical protein